MAAADPTLAAAEQAMLVERRGQRRRRLWIAGAAASYAVDALFLLLFALAGAAPLWVAGAYAGGALLLNAVVYAAMASERNLSLRDPSLVMPQAVCGALLQAGVALAVPALAFPWLANLVTVLAFATIWLSVRASLALWTVCAAACAAVFFLHAGHLGTPSAGAAQVGLSWLFFSIILGRLVFLGSHSAAMRTRLHESRAKLAASIQQVRDLASHDELTKALNRRAIVERLEQERAAAQRNGLALCVALFDLDHFKAVNDAHGHAAGDQVLRSFARIVRATMRETDIFGRYGGEEFLMILTDTMLDGGRRALERVRNAVAEASYEQIAPGLALTVSIGLAQWKRDEETTQLLARADRALYQAKEHGRNRIEAE